MSDGKQLRIDVNDALKRLEHLEIVIQNIANGYWNAGREEPISAEEYAREVLDPAGTTLARIAKERASL